MKNNKSEVYKEKTQNKSKPKKLITTLAISFVAVVLVVVVSLVIFLPKGSEAYDFVSLGIENAEALSDFLVEYETRQIVTFGDATQDIITGGHVMVLDDKDSVSIEINTESYSSFDENGNAKASVTLYSDDEGVYDISTGTKEKVDISKKEFDEIVGEIGLYRYDPKKVTNEQYTKNQKEELSAGVVTVSLSEPDKKVLEAYADEISKLAGEKVEAKDLVPVAAFVQYNIFENKVISQSYTFTVEYEASNDKTIKYTVSSDISYVSDFSESDYDSFIPFE